MLHIILLILKVIGIILAVILGIIVLLLLLALFIPLKYKVTAAFPGDIEKIAAEIKVSFFLHLISGRVSYKEQQLTYKVRAAFKKWDSEDAQSEEKAEAKEKEPEKEQAEPQEVLNGQEPDVKEKKPVQINKEKETEEKVKIETKKEVQDIIPIKSEEQKGRKRRKKRKKMHTFLEIPKRLYQKLLHLIERIKYTFRNFCAKIKVLLKKKETLERFIENETHKNAFTKAKREAFRLLKMVKPKKLKASILFGFDDPYLTGKALAGVSMIYPFIGGCTDITPDFERAVLEGDLYIRGNIRLIYFVIPAIHLLFDKNIRRTYKHIRNLKL